jgi:opacity protein-like surface antigen
LWQNVGAAQHIHVDFSELRGNGTLVIDTPSREEEDSLMKYAIVILSKQLVALVVGAVLGAPLVVAAQEAGHFSGVRFGASEKAWTFTAPGLKLGQALEFARAGEIGNTAFSGYQFQSGFALGAAVNTDRADRSDRAAAIVGSGVGLKMDLMRWAESRQSVNVDVVSAFNWQNSFSVFGKVGVGRADGRVIPEWISSAASAQDRTALTYGVGMRYDFTHSLGLKLEVTRGTRFGWDRLRTDIDPDAVNLGIRWSF